MKVFVEVSHLAAALTRNRFADAIQEIQDCGATGVSVNDHIFATYDGRRRSQGSTVTCDPLTTLAVVAGLSDQLAVEAIVVNTAWIHPGLVLRQFLQLAQFLGGERVTAGLGAGWSREEFDALGLTMPPFAERMARLHEVLRAARTLFKSGIASVEGQHITVRDLPLSPRPAVPPALLVGGGSDRVLAMAGQYADVIDLHGHPGRGKVTGATMHDARRGDVLRRALTTVDDLVERMQLVDQASREAGRAPSSLSVSGSIFYTAYGSRSAVEYAERDLCRNWAGIPPQSLRNSPYLLFGEPQQMADALQERQAAYRLDRITLLTETGVASAPADPLRFCREVLPLLNR